MLPTSVEAPMIAIERGLNSRCRSVRMRPLLRVSARLGPAADVEIVDHGNDEALSRTVQLAVGVAFTREVFGEQHVAGTEYAFAARAGDLGRARDRDDELALLGRVVLAL